MAARPPVLRDSETLARAWLDRRGAGRALQPTWRQITVEINLVKGAFLQVSCGASWLGLHVASGHPELDVVGIDTDVRALAVAEQHRGTRLNVTLREMSPTHIVYPERTFHAAASVSALRGWEDPAAVLAEVHRVLRPGARFLVYELDAEAEALPAGWVALPGLPDALALALLRRRGPSAQAWGALKEQVRESPFGGGEDGRHGPFRRLVLTRRAT